MISKLAQSSILIAIIGTLFSCNHTQSGIDKASSMIENAEKNQRVLSQEDFDKMGIKMEALQKDLEENRKDYTDEQVKEIGKLQGRYAAIAIKKGMNDFQESVNDLGNQMEGFIEGITDTTNNK
jgi:hypothetical protein